MGEHKAESMVVNLVHCSYNVFAYAQRMPQVEGAPQKNSARPRPWGSILKELLGKCPEFSKDNTVAARWRETNHRKVLTPLRENSENIIANFGMSRKRKADSPLDWIPNKVPRLNNMKPCTVNVTRTPLERLQLEYKYCNNRPFVKLFDVTKEIPQVKEEEKPLTQEQFMDSLGLGQPVVREYRHKLKVNHPTKLLNYPGIPFSSDYGRLLLLRERHCLQDDAALRKIERVERYIQNDVEVLKKPQDFEVTYNKHISNLHRYKFPRRQFSQKHKSLYEAFTSYACKPVCVHLEKLDLNFLEIQRNKEKSPQQNTPVLIEDAPDKNSESVNSVVELKSLNHKEKTKTVAPRKSTVKKKKYVLRIRKKKDVLRIKKMKNLVRIKKKKKY